MLHNSVVPSFVGAPSIEKQDVSSIKFHFIKDEVIYAFSSYQRLETLPGVARAKSLAATSIVFSLSKLFFYNIGYY